MATSAKTNTQEVDDWDSSPKKVASSDGLDDWEGLNASKKRAKEALNFADQALARGKKDTQDAKDLVTDAPKHFPRNTSDLENMAIAAPVGAAQAVTLGHVPQVAGGITSLIKGAPYLQERDQAAKDISEIRARAPFTYGAGNLLTNAIMARALPGTPTVTKAAGLGAAQGALYNPGDKEGQYGGIDELKSRAKQAAMAALLSGSMQGAGNLSVNAGDRLMQKAVGRTKFTPGVGEEIANEGVWGTKEMMKNQVNKKTSAIAAETRGLTRNHPNLISSQPIADEVSALNDRWKIPSGRVNSSQDIPAMVDRQRYANEINSRGMQPAEDILQDRINAGQRVPETSWENRSPQERLTTEISKAEQRGASNQLKANVPGVAELDERFVPLAKAKKPLNKEENLNRMQGMIPRVASIPGSSLGLSTMGQGAVKLGHGLQNNKAALINSLLEQFMARQHYPDEGQK